MRSHIVPNLYFRLKAHLPVEGVELVSTLTATAMLVLTVVTSYVVLCLQV